MLLENSIWLDDIDVVLADLPELSDLSGKSILITGASGLICSAIIDILIRYNETKNESIGILAAGRDRGKIEKRFGKSVGKEYFCYVKYDSTETDINLELDADYIIHGAGNAFPQKIITEPVETMLSSIVGVHTLFRLSENHNIRRLLFISSSEIYGNKYTDSAFAEDDYGYIDLLNPRSSYSMGKRAAETMCVSYAMEYGIESVIARPGHIYGPTASRMDNRVSSVFAWKAARGEDLILKSDGLQLRSYCYCLDCASAILKILLKGKNLQAYNISNSKSVINIRQMAEQCARIGNVHVVYEQVSEQEKNAFNPMTNSSLSSRKIEQLGWKGQFDAYTGFDHTIRIIRESMINDEGDRK